MTVDELNAITAQFGELFKQFLTNPIFRQNIDLLMRVPIQEKDAQNVLQTLKFVEDKYNYELRDSEAPWKPHILNFDESIDKLTKTTPPLHSFCRFGDGECQIMMGKSIGFQEYDARLADRLRQILADDATDCYVGINRYYWYIKDDIDRNSNERLKRWYIFEVPKYRDFFATHCNKNKTYIDSCIGAYMANKSDAECISRFSKLQALFQGKKLVIFAGETVFQNIQYDFFGVAAHKEIVLSPRVNAYKMYDKIIAKALSYPKDHIFVFILRPTATVATYELSAHGYVAYDMGHIAKDYDAFMKKADRSPMGIAKFFSPD